MGQISVEVNHNSYTLACRDGEEERLEELARYVANKAASLSERVGQVGEARLLLMVSILLADELRDARDQLITSQRGEYQSRQKAERGATSADALADGHAAKEAEEKAAGVLSRLTERLEGIVAGLEKA